MAGKKQIFTQGAIAVAVSLLFQPQPLLANPTGAQVVNGVVSMVKPNASTLNVTNSPGAIINWQGFSIGAGEVTRFIQQSSSSMVLNRVVGADISSLQGQLLSNGRVFLINPAGILIGPNAMLDTAGFVGSTLNMQNADFLAGKLRFSGDATSGAIINQGWIRTSYGGNILLVAPHIENSGLIQTPGGELILAAGQKVTVASLEQEGVQFEVQAPTDAVVNVGKLLADGGAVGLFAGTLRHSGEIRANALVRDAGGNVVLKAANDIQIAAGSVTSASGKSGGAIAIESGSGHTRVAGQVLATGSEGKGGVITLLGDRVTATDGALVDASGATGGGTILLGGDYQGANAAVRNASKTFVGSRATLRANATELGDGGRIIVWADGNTQFYGSLSAQGGPLGGNGGFAEVSGKKNLIFDGIANLGAPRGALGNLLLDPLDLYIFSGGGIDGASGGTQSSTIMDEATDFPASAVSVSPATLAGIAGNVTLFASRYMRISNDITLTTPGQSLTATVGTYTAPALPDPNALNTIAPNRLDIAANITTDNGAVTLNAPFIQGVATSKIATNGGAITLNSGSSVSAAQLSLAAGAGAVTVNVGAAAGDFIELGTAGGSVLGGSVSASAPGSLSFGKIATGGGAGALALTSTGSSVFVNDAIVSSGGAVTINAPSFISTGNITGGGGAVTLAANAGVFTGVIDTTGAVALAAASGSVSATVNNASGLIATANFGVTINSATDLNVTTVTAGSGSTASLITTNGTIRATSDAATISGLDVTLRTGQKTGGGILGAKQPLNVDVQRTFTFDPNGDFDVLLAGAGPNRLISDLGVAAAGKTYAGTLTRSSSGLTLAATANSKTVTISKLAITSGFDQRVSFSDPEISINVPNGALVANAVTVPAGGNVPAPDFPDGVALPVTLQSLGNLTLNSYTRAGGGLPKQTTITSDNGMVILGSLNASKDAVNVTGFGGVKALTDAPGLEITTAGALTISTSSGNIGASGAANPLDMAASTISLNASQFGSRIGGAKGPVIANTSDLTVSAGGEFNVSTGVTALNNLTLTADAAGVGGGGLARVRTESGGANDKTYSFNSDGADFTVAIGKVPLTQFAGGTFKFTSNSGGKINLTGNTNLGSGNLELVTSFSEINSAGSNISAADVKLRGNNTINTGAGAITATGKGGNIELGASAQVTTGDLNAQGEITIAPTFLNPAVTVGAIGNKTAPQTITIDGSTVSTGAVTGSTITINGSTVGIGAVTGSGSVTLKANSGLLTLGGAVNTANGEAITLLSADGAKALNFTTLDAGVTGTVSITSAAGIQQNGAGGITAKTVTLSAPNAAAPINQLGGDGNLDLMGTQALTLTAGGPVALDANGSVLTALTFTKTETPAAAPFTLANLGGGQTVSIVNGTNPFELEVKSAKSPLNFTLDYSAGQAKLVGSGINSGGGDVSLTLTNAANSALDASGGIVTGGGSVTVNLTKGAFDASSGGINTRGATGGGAVTLTTPGLISTNAINTTPTGTGAGGAITLDGGGIVLNGDLRSGSGAIALTSSAAITRNGGAQIISAASVSASASKANIGASGTPLLITSPNVALNATAGTGGGNVFATLINTSNLTLSGDTGFDVSSNTAFKTLSVATKGTRAGTLTLTAPGQTFAFARPATDLFGAPVTGKAFEVVSVNAPAANATFTASDGVLLIRGAPGTPNRINVHDLTLNSASGGDIRLQGNAANPLLLSHANQTFSASGGATADVLIRGTATLSATTSQSLTASGNINVSADAGGSGTVTITAPHQSFTTAGVSSKMEFLGGAAAGEKVMVTAGNSQIITSTSGSVDSVKFKGGAGDGATVTLSHSGSGAQQFQVDSGTVTVQGGKGLNAFARIEEKGANQQQLCRDTLFGGCAGGIGTLSILGGSGIGAYAQVTAVGAQLARVNTATNVTGGAGDGAYALMQAGTTQTFLNAGNVTLLGGSGATATAQITATGNQTINAFGTWNLTGGVGANALARISTGGNQSFNFGPLNMTGGLGSGSFVEIVASGTQSFSGFGAMTLKAGGTLATPGTSASATIQGNSQTIFADAITLLGGAGNSEGGTSDAILRNLSGNQSVTANSVTLTGGVQSSTAGILNQGMGTQTVSGSIQLDSGTGAGTGSTAVLVQNTPATLQTLTANSGGIRIENRGAGIVSITSGGDQTVTAPFLDVHTAPIPGSTGDSILAATGNQWIRTTNGTLSPTGSMRVAALGTGLANIESGASQLIELDYPGQMQGLTVDGRLTIGDLAAAGKSRVGAVDQSVFAKSILVQTGGPAAGTQSELKSSGKQVISVLNGNLAVFGGSGNNSLAQIDPLDQTILVNGPVTVQGGGGMNAVAQIVSQGTQTLWTTNGNINIIGGDPSFPGGSGVGSTASITAAGVQSLSSSTPPPVITPNVGGAFVGGLSASSSSSSTSSSASSASTGTVLALQDNQIGVIAEAEPDQNNESNPIRRAPICF